jgi:hypothetical protein
MICQYVWTILDSLLLCDSPAVSLDAKHRSGKYDTRAVVKQTAQSCLFVGLTFKRPRVSCPSRICPRPVFHRSQFCHPRQYSKCWCRCQSNSSQPDIGIRHSRLQAFNQTFPQSPGSIEDPNDKLQHGSCPALLVHYLSFFSLHDILLSYPL